MPDRALEPRTRRGYAAVLMLTSDDLASLAAHGISADEARRQLALLAHPPAPIRLDRACTIGDGIEQLSDARAEALGARAREAVSQGRVTAFVPASGAATRMFRELLAARPLAEGLSPEALRSAATAGTEPLASLHRFVAELPRFAFERALMRSLERRGRSLAALREQGPYTVLLDALLADGGLGYARLPKGLLPFHRTPEGPRTAFEEHLVDAAHGLRDSRGTCRLHVTVSPEHRAEFEAALASARSTLEGPLGARFDVTFSVQPPSTDTLAADERGEPLRNERGELVLRPAGHGALIENLARLGADLVFVRNIDNVASGAHAEPARRWATVLLGRLAELEAELRAALDALERGDAQAEQEATRLAVETFHHLPPTGGERRVWLAQALDRPLRVCGMVANQGEPGGGPFWVRGRDGSERPQIVESAQVDEGSAEQRERFASGTHFNPVFMALGLRERNARPYPLEPFVDREAVMLTRKSHGGRAITALERPGLWNGAMAHWNSVFVEVPVAVFNPVKTVFDLLRREHQTEGGPRAAGI
jgi:hypothetical protein